MVADYFNKKHQRARKSHKCCDCRQEIKPGEKYVRTSLVEDGTWHDFKHCSFCDDVMESAIEYAKDENYSEDCWPCYGFLRDWVMQEDHFMLTVWPFETWPYFVEMNLATESHLNGLIA